MEKTLDKDDYRGPIARGQRWRSRGVGGHNYALFSVVQYNGRTVVVTPEGNVGRSIRKGNRHSYPEPKFRRDFVLVKQAPGVVEVAIPAEIVEALAEVAEDIIDAEDREAAQRATLKLATTDSRAWLTGTRPQDLYHRGLLAQQPVPPEEIEEVYHAFRPLSEARPREESPATMSSPHAAPAEPVANPVIPHEVAENLGYVPAARPEAPEVAEAPPEPEVVEAIPLPPAAPPEGGRTEEDPLEAFLANGRALVDRLGAEVAGLEGERDRLLEQAEEVDARARARQAQRDRVLSAIEGAVAALGGTPAPREALPPQPAHQDGRSVQAFPGAGTKTSWVLDQMVARGTVTVQDLVPGWVQRFGGTTEKAIKGISGILSHQTTRSNPNWPVPVRTGTGTYRVP